MKITEDDKYLMKLKLQGWLDCNIARKMGITEDQVKERWNSIQTLLAAGHASGYAALLDHFTVLCHQYQMLGESLKIVAAALGNQVTEKQLSSLVEDNREHTVKNLMGSCIILHPFIPITPEESLKNTLGKN